MPLLRRLGEAVRAVDFGLFGPGDMLLAVGGQPLAMASIQRTAPTTPYAVVLLLFAAVGMTLFLGIAAAVTLAVGDHVLGVELAGLALAVAAGTRFVTDRASRPLSRG
jgi:hypothetical protein